MALPPGTTVSRMMVSSFLTWLSSRYIPPCCIASIRAFCTLSASRVRWSGGYRSSPTARSPSSGRTPAERRIEHTVLRQIGKRSPGQRSRRMMSLRLAGAGVLVVVFAAVFLRSGRTPVPLHTPDFTESVLLLDDHVCIWLEPVNGNASGEVEK